MEVYEDNIGRKVRKTSRTGCNPKPFKSGLRFNTVKGVVNHPVLSIPAYTFVEDDTIVECQRCVVIPTISK